MPVLLNVVTSFILEKVISEGLNFPGVNLKSPDCLSKQSMRTQEEYTTFVPRPHTPVTNSASNEQCVRPGNKTSDTP